MLADRRLRRELTRHIERVSQSAINQRRDVIPPGAVPTSAFDSLGLSCPGRPGGLSTAVLIQQNRPASYVHASALNSPPRGYAFAAREPRRLSSALKSPGCATGTKKKCCTQHPWLTWAPRETAVPAWVVDRCREKILPIGQAAAYRHWSGGALALPRPGSFLAVQVKVDNDANGAPWIRASSSLRATFPPPARLANGILLARRREGNAGCHWTTHAPELCFDLRGRPTVLLVCHGKGIGNHAAWRCTLLAAGARGAILDMSAPPLDLKASGLSVSSISNAPRAQALHPNTCPAEFRRRQGDLAWKVFLTSPAMAGSDPLTAPPPKARRANPPQTALRAGG